MNGDTIGTARDAGADLLVAGSAIFWQDDPGGAYRDSPDRWREPVRG